MSRVDELVAYQKALMAGVSSEIIRVEKLPETGSGKSIANHTDQDKLIAELELERRCLRDTISYLEAFKKHGVQP
jgi:hypothetical protein